MSPAQKILRAVLPARWFADLETETRQWEVACRTCGRSRDLWEAGGLRWRAASEQSVAGYCSACEARRKMVIRRRQDA
ncbi:hypothetical protein [Jannaschia aquimarina]|uniref:Uncharacterized protein n=1 Tax=Jannaschia aquimarina TaxID=935700 RepID=A0A0D1EEY9_9RHOB|nr:hypothetical protein [Jannaschia aquimarina]KIT14465.1 hypothetical protein jaqu_37550 [Jannaschia aquimarina]SNT28999.1 hypothetical protein SAMN05421775_11044 [Jannaschia aquimarina]